jgi:ADYC domain
MKRHFLILTCLLVGTPALAAAPQKKEARSVTKAERRARPCQGQAPQRHSWPQGTLLWGTSQKAADKVMSSVLTSLDLGQVQLGGAALKGVDLEDGRLVAPSAPEGLVGAMLQGTDSDGQPVEVALCDARPSPDDATMVWYSIEVWNAESASWENPCVATNRMPQPRALAVEGVWDATGARHDEKGKFTFACENGAIAKCADWGYKPWAKKDGRALKDLHQACTRMARADYCGDGRSHTHEDNIIDMYDVLKLLTRTTEASAAWNPARASFEAAWTPDGASCLARTRDGQAVEAIMKECPGRFEPVAKDLGEGDHCTVSRKSGRSAEAALLRNHSYGNGEQALLQGAAQ